MKTLVIAPQPFFSPRGTPFSVYYRTLVMAQLGIPIDLLTYGEGQDVDIPGVSIIRIPRFALLGNVKTGPSLLKLFLDVFLVAWTVGLLLTRRYQLVHAHEEAVFFCRFLKPIFGFKLIYDMHSSLPQQLTNFNFTQSSLLIGLFKKLEDSSLRASDAVITICPALSDHVNQLLADPEKHFLIENSIFEPVHLTSRRAGQRPNAGDSAPVQHLPDVPAGRPLVVYAGTLASYQGIGLLIESFKLVHDHNPDVMLLVVGGKTEQVAKYSSLADSLGLTGSCQFTGIVPQSTARELMARASVVVSPRIEGTNTPLKIYELLASDKPLVATRIYSHTQVLNAEVAFLAEPVAEDFARQMNEALYSEAESKKKTRGAKKLYQEKYSRQVYQKKVSDLLAVLA